MQIKKTAEGIWEEYGKGKSYNNSINLYETVKKCENFYIGRQWEGLRAPDLPKPVINVTKRVVSYFIAMLVSNDVGVKLDPYNKTKTMIPGPDGNPVEIIKEELDVKAIEAETDKVIEMCDLKSQVRKIVRNAAIDGDAYMYFYFDETIDAGNGAKGGIVSEIIDNTSVIFGNPYSSDVQKQPYILIATQRMISDVKEEAKRNGAGEQIISQISADSDSDMYAYKESGRDELCTVITKLWRENGTVHAIRTTKDVVIREVWNTEYKRYPIANMVWEHIRNCYHGEGAVAQIIPNQICINQAYAMSIHWAKTSAIQKIIYDATKIPSWSNKVGQAIGIIGNPNEAVTSVAGGANMNPQMMNIINSLMQNTEECMGANDAALGNIRPDNTSAIIATQNAAAMPLEIQRLEYSRFMEDCIRIIIDIIRTDYGPRRGSIELDGMTFDSMFDFGTMDTSNYNLKVDIGQSSYWSELTQIQTADNLLAKGIIPDAETYLESIPDKFIRNKAKILKQIREKAKQAEMMAQMQTAQPAPVPPMMEGGI